jgi:uncharacterized protein (TIGR03066 family)
MGNGAIFGISPHRRLRLSVCLAGHLLKLCQGIISTLVKPRGCFPLLEARFWSTSNGHRRLVREREVRMNVSRLIILGLAVCASTVPVLAQEAQPDIAKLLPGVWEVTKGEPNIITTGSTLKFDKNGDMWMTIKRGGQEAKFELTYKLDGRKLSFTVKGSKGARTITIKKLTDQELWTEESNGKIIQMKRKK